jgi:hypothetical protein
MAQEVDFSVGKDLNSNAYVTSIKIGLPIEYKKFSLTPYGGWETWAEYQGNILTGKPFRDTYSMGLKLNFQFNERTSFYIDGYRFCTHNVKSYDDQNNLMDSKFIRSNEKWGHSMTAVRFGITAKINSFRLD